MFGVYSFQGPKAGLAVFGAPSETVDLTFGATTVVTGTVGTLLGGAVLDRLGATSANALRICACACVVGCAFHIHLQVLEGCPCPVEGIPSPARPPPPQIPPLKCS